MDGFVIHRNVGGIVALADPDDYAEDHELWARFAALRVRHLRFFGLNWFEQVSSQLQGMELFDILRKRSHAQREFDIVGRSIVEAQAFFDQCAKARAERVDRRKEDLLRFATIFLSFLGIAGFIVSVADGGDSWLKSVLIRAMAGLAGEDPLKEWRYELAAYVTVVILAALARLGIFRLPGQERAEGVGQLWLSGGIGLALLAPFMVSNVANFGGGASLAVILPLGVGWMVTQARPNVLKGARREFHAAWLLMTLLIGGLAFMTSMHALDATH